METSNSNYQIGYAEGQRDVKQIRIEKLEAALNEICVSGRIRNRDKDYQNRIETIISEVMDNPENQVQENKVQCKTAADNIIEHCRAYGLMSNEKRECTESPWWLIIDPLRMRNSFEDYKNEIPDLIAKCISGPYFSREAAEKYLKEVSHHFSKEALVYCCGAKDAYQWEWFARQCNEMAKVMPK